jgi:hypothetical protein
MNILDLKQFQHFNHAKDVKILRHRSFDNDLWLMVDDGTFPAYQNKQDRNVFGGANYIISFIAERDRYAIFVGVWKVLGQEPHPDDPTHYLYHTEKCEGYDSLKKRLVIDWGAGTRSWIQWLHTKGNKPVSELLPANYVKQFPGYYDFILSYHELKQIIDHPDANREWHRMLSSISGVYLILNKATGEQYVGSAYGKGGILSRWRGYSKNPSGGNKLIQALLTTSPEVYNDFQFSILRVLEPGSTKADVLGQESLLKKKLGSRAFGLNAN